MGDAGKEFIENYMRIANAVDTSLGNSYATFDHNEFLANVANSQSNYPYPTNAVTVSGDAPKKNMDYYLAFADKNLYQAQTVIRDETKPDYMEEETYKAHVKKEILAQMNEALLKKVVFTSQRDFKTFDTTVRGRVYMFNRQELIDLIKECLKV